jgi:polyribonucleotide nucleotidyltransferase
MSQVLRILKQSLLFHPSAWERAEHQFEALEKRENEALIAAKWADYLEKPIKEREAKLEALRPDIEAARAEFEQAKQESNEAGVFYDQAVDIAGGRGAVIKVLEHKTKAEIDASNARGRLDNLLSQANRWQGQLTRLRQIQGEFRALTFPDPEELISIIENTRKVGE